MHLHQENAAVLVLASQVEHRRTPVGRVWRELAVHILQILDMPLAIEQVVQQINQQHLAVLLTEQDLETTVHEWTDKYAFFHK